jgi:hypothetical protein
MVNELDVFDKHSFFNCSFLSVDSDHKRQSVFENGAELNLAAKCGALLA